MTSPVASKTILVVEDDPSVRTLLSRALGIKYRVLEAEDGMDAMSMLKNGPSVDLIITDVMMPRMNGYALARTLKALGPFKNVPIIFLTARTSAADVVAGINVGARHYIAKPFSVKDVTDKVAKILK